MVPWNKVVVVGGFVLTMKEKTALKVSFGKIGQNLKVAPKHANNVAIFGCSNYLPLASSSVSHGSKWTSDWDWTQHLRPTDASSEDRGYSKEAIYSSSEGQEDTAGMKGWNISHLTLRWIQDLFWPNPCEKTNQDWSVHYDKITRHLSLVLVR